MEHNETLLLTLFQKETMALHNLYIYIYIYIYSIAVKRYHLFCIACIIFLRHLNVRNIAL